MGAVKLGWYRLEEKDQGQWSLTIGKCDDFKTVLVDALEGLRHIGLRASSTEGMCFTYIKGATSSQIERLRNFLTLLEEILLIRKSPSLESEFEDELRYCAAMDFNLVKEESVKRTTIGDLEYRAKYQRDEDSLKELARQVVAMVKRHDVLKRVDWVAAMPSSTDDSHVNVAQFVATAIAYALDVEVTVIKKEPTAPLKGLAVKEKISVLSDALDFDDEVAGSSVLVVDDLCQSGTSLWTAARAAVEAGADRVYGLVCVKSWRDTDNT